MIRSLGFILKQIKYLVHILFDATIPHALCIEKTLCNTSSVSERGEPQCGDPRHRITFNEINSINTDNIDWYIIKFGPV